MIALLVEDEQDISYFIKTTLEDNNITVETAADGEEAIEKVTVRDYDAVILDIMLPKKDGIEVCAEIRRLDLKVPVLMLTAKGRTSDKVFGLNVGADDYLAKPFNVDELLARVHALMRRGHDLKPPVLQVMDLTLDPASHEVKRSGKLIALTNKEYRILEYLMRNEGAVCSRTMVNEHVWGFNYVQSNVIDVYIKRLRDKVDGSSPVKLIQTVRNIGYKLKAMA